MDINTAIPCGLIINELTSNAMKHAFPEDMEGEINIKFHQKDHKLILTFKDNGIGLAPDLEFENTSSLGLKLVNTLVSQINGEIQINSDSGTNITIKFPEETFDK
jgi:two-component sensor histidine kinase